MANYNEAQWPHFIKLKTATSKEIFQVIELLILHTYNRSRKFKPKSTNFELRSNLSTKCKYHKIKI